MRTLRHLHHRSQLELGCAFDERLVKRDQPGRFGAKSQNTSIFERQTLPRIGYCSKYLVSVLHFYCGQSQYSIQSRQCLVVRKSQHAARQGKVHLHNHGCADKEPAFAKQGACSFKLRIGLPRQKPQNNVSVNGNQRTCPHAARALAATALQRMRLPFSSGASMPATSSTLRCATAAFSTASPLRTSQRTGSLAEICKAASTVGGTDKDIVGSELRINLPPISKLHLIVGELAWYRSLLHTLKLGAPLFTKAGAYDLNQDGVRKVNELQTLQATGVQSIKLIAALNSVHAATSSAEHRKERARTFSRLKQRNLRCKYGCSQRGVCASSYEIHSVN